MLLRMALCLLTCVACIERASATVLLPTDFATSVTEATVIVHGRVVAVRSMLNAPRRLIESFVTVDVLESLKGDTGSTVTFSVPNGQVGRYRRVLIGAPEFLEGDEVVVFLHGRAPIMPTLLGLSQGVYRVRRDAAARAVVLPPLVASRGIGAERVVRGDPARQPVPIEGFAREVRAVLERAR